MTAVRGGPLDFDAQIGAESAPRVDLGEAPLAETTGVDVMALALTTDVPAEVSDDAADDAPDGDADGPPNDGGSRADTRAALLGVGLDLDEVLATQPLTGKVGECLLLPVPDGDEATASLVALVGVGAASADDLRRAGATLARALTRPASSDEPGLSVATTIHTLGLEPFVVGLVLGSFDLHARSTGPRSRPPSRVVLARSSESDGAASTDADREALDRASLLARASWAARALATVPSNVKTPAWLADQAVRIAEAVDLSCTVWDESTLEKRGFNGLLAVGRASVHPPRLVRLEYKPRRATGHVVLVGKGITFDSGGLSIKPAEGMATMKRDMTGGAVVIATMSVLARLGCPVRVTALVCAAENSVGASSLRPGDVIRHYGGRTTEVTNTDAEGRLVMADALAHASADLEPDAIIDVATLTGAVKVSLGRSMGGLFANDEALGAALAAAGDEAGEPLWRLPLVADYEEKIASKVADADNAGGGPGAITAALFLQHFVGGTPWAHLDIASVGDAPSSRYEWSEGPTGFGVRALATWLSGPDPLAGVGD